MSSGDSWVKPPPLPNLADAQSVVGGSVIPQDDAIQQHYVRLQKTLFHSVDQELDDMHLKMKEAIDNLKQTEDDKTAIGVALYQANSKIGRMNHQLQTV